jgi:L-fuculose-phosphate aldolase
MDSLAEQIVYTGRVMFTRRLTDIAGGNISARDGDALLITPRYAGSKQHWNLQPGDLLRGPWQSDELLVDPRVSREAGVHLAIYRAFPQAVVVIHAHAFHIQPFVAAEKPVEPVLEHTQKYGWIGFCQYAPSHTPELGGYVVAALSEKAGQICDCAAAVMIPQHGIVVVSADLLSALDALERIDWNCWCLLARKNI